MEVPPPHIRIDRISAISTEGAVRFMTSKRATDGALLMVSRGRSIRTSGRKISPIVDRLEAHEEATVPDWVEADQGRIELFFMPPDTPE